MSKLIQGAGGDSGGGGGGRTPKIAADTLASKQYAKILDLISEGEIVGLADGEKSIYLDNTPLMASDGTYNFNSEGIQIESRVGTQTQTPMTLFTSQEVEVSVDNKEITTLNPFVVRITEPYLDKIRLNMSIPRLSVTNIKNGDVNGSEVAFNIYLKENASKVTAPLPEFKMSNFNAQSNSTADDLLPLGPSFTASSVTTVTTDLAKVNLVATMNYNLANAYKMGTFTLVMGSKVQYKLPASSTWTESGVTTTMSLTYRYTPETGDVTGGTEYTGTYTILGNPPKMEILSREGNSLLDVPLPYYGTWDIRIVEVTNPWQYNEITVNEPTSSFNFNGQVTISYASYNKPGFYPLVDKVYYDGMSGPFLIKGKASSPYRFSIDLDIRGLIFPIDIKVERTTADPPDQYTSNRLFAESYTKIATERLSYPNSALVGVKMDSSQFNTIPARTYDMYLMKVKIPDGYDAKLRTYPSIWTGDFVVGWTDNPAWVFYDLCTNTRYGLGNYIPVASIDIFQLYSIAKYCDELVPDGFGGMEPRYTCNLYLQGREEAYKVISQLAALFSSIVYWGVGAINILSDMTADSSFTFTNSNVAEGVFNYSTGSLKDSHTVALVSYIDKENNYKPAIEYVEDSEGVENKGIKEVEVIAYGCTSRGQAHRMGRRMLLTEKLEGELLQFKTGLNAAYCRPGAIIRVEDNTLSDSGLLGGRIISTTESSITFDREVPIANGSSYTVNITLPNGKTKIVALENPNNESYTTGVVSNFQTLNLKNSPDYFNYGTNTYPVNGSIWVITKDAELSYSLWRVLGVKESDDLVYEVSCIKYDPTKASQIESGLDLPPKTSIGILDVEVPPIPATILNPLYTPINGEPQYINNVTVAESLYRIGKADIATKLNIGWQGVLGASEYIVRYRIDSNNWITRIINVPYLEIENCQDGEVYELELFVSNIVGKKSTAYTLSHTIVGKLADPDAILGLYASRNLKTISLQWDPSTEVDLAGYEIRQYTTPVKTWETADVLISGITSNRYDTEVSGLATTYTYLVKAIDTTGHYSATAASVSVTITIPSTPSISATIQDGTVLLKTTPGSVGGTQLPISKYDIVYGTSYESPSGDIQEGAVDTSYDTIDYASRTYWVKSIDTGGNYSVSSSVAVIINQTTAVQALAYTYKNGKIYLTWSPPATGVNTTPLSYYKVYRGNTVSYTNATFLLNTTNPNYSQVIDWAAGASEKFWVVPIDSRGEALPGVENSVLAATANLLAPGSMTSTQVGPTLLVTWTPPASSVGIDLYTIKIGGTDWASATLLGTTGTGSYYVPLTSPGNLIVRVKATDVNGQISPEASVNYTYTAPGVVNTLSYVVENSNVKLSWTPPTNPALAIDKYEIIYNGSTVGFTYSNSFSIKADWVGDRVFSVKSVDIAANSSAATNITTTITAPAAPVVTLSFSGSSVQVDYTVPASSLAIAKYEVRKGGTAWGVGDTLVEVSTNNTVWDELHAANTAPVTYRVKAYDIVGVTSGSIGSNSISVVAPSITNVTTQVVDNNVLLYWNSTQGSLPIVTYEVRRGATWGTSTLIGSKSGGFTSVFETIGGTYVYWIAAIDTAGNYSTPISRSALVNSPPDYIFKHSYNSNWQSQAPDIYTNITVSKTNCALDTALGGLVAPIYTAETWATHFSTRSWASIQAQIDAGYVVYAQPSNTTSADYVEEIDYGNTVGAMKISVSYAGATIAGSITTNCYISYKLNIGDSWSSEINAVEVFAINFRYVKVRINMAAANQQSLYNLTSLSVKLDAKAKSDANSLYAIAEDAAGTSVVWSNGVSFADIGSISVQPKLIATTGTLTHSITATTCTITCTTNNLAIGDKIYVSFTGGTPPPAATYTLTSRTATTLVFTVPSGSGSGTPTIKVPMYALYDFTDAPNPTGFKVYLYDITGTRASGYVSWAAEGY